MNAPSRAKTCALACGGPKLRVSRKKPHPRPLDLVREGQVHLELLGERLRVVLALGELGPEAHDLALELDVLALDLDERALELGVLVLNKGLGFGV